MEGEEVIKTRYNEEELLKGVELELEKEKRRKYQ